MKRSFIHTAKLLQAVLLFGVLSFVNTPAKAQNADQRALMPDAFEAMNPATVIGDGNYYYIQFYFGSDISYLSDQGAGNNLRTKDYIPFAKNLQWTLVSTGTANQFKLKSLNGVWAYLDGTYKGTNDENAASTLTFYNHSGGGYDIGTTANPANAMAGNNNKGPWVDVYDNDKGNARCRLRVAKLKDNVAHIIYWQEPIYKDGNVVDRNTNTRGGAEGFTTHHYLTYSGTGNVISDEVSSRRSVLWYYDAWQLPTAAAYHQDGLWTLESAGSNGEFYIKKYGTEEYLNYDGNRASVLETKSADYGKYSLESPGANRYTRIQNDNRFVADELTTSMFHWWDGWGANASQTSQEVPTLTYNVGNNVTVSTSNAPVIGDDWRVRYLLYADLTGYSKIVFEGTPGLELRVLLNRDAPDGTDGDWGGAFLDWHCTIGDNGKGELSLSELAFAHLNSIKVYGGSGTISSIKLMKPDFVKTDMANAEDWFKSWDVDGNQTGNATNIAFNVGSTVNAGETIAGDGNVYYLTYANLTNSKKIVFEGTPGVQLRVLLNRQGDGGPLVEKAATISNFGKAEVDISDLPFVHLHAIKAGWNSPSGVITAIKVMTPAYGGNSLFLSCANTDGNPVTQAAGNTASDWYAGFLPVEVPVPNKDEFYQVLVKWGANMINHGGGVTAPCPTNEADYDLWQLEMIDDYGHFRLKAPNGRYLKPNGTGMTEPNNPEGAEIMDNAKFFLDDDRDFTLTWYYVNPAQKEIPVNHYVTHRESYLKEYAQEYASLHLDKQGLTTEADSEWKNWNGNLGGFTQKVNHFEITHYIKRNDTKVIDFPTVLNKSNDHIYFQRFYNYNEVDTAMNLDNLKAHVSLDDRDDGSVQYFLYRNGMVTGQKLDWHWDDGTAIPDGGYARNEQRRFNFTNSDGKPFTVAVDVSRYSDMTYADTTAHLQGNLEEPSLTMRYIYFMKDAKEMAAQLTACTEGSNKWLETKVFHFPVRQIFYEKQKKVGYRGEFIGVRHLFSDYWVFDNAAHMEAYNAAVAAGQKDLSAFNEYLVSAVDNNQGGKIEVVIDDPNGTGIRLGGWNPSLAALHGGNLKFVDDVDTYDADIEADFRGFYFYDKMSDQNKTQYGDSRFVCFRYPGPDTDGKVRARAAGPENPAYVNVYLNNEGVRYQLAQFTIIFDAGTVTLPYKSVHGSDYVAKDLNNPNHEFAWRGPKKLIEQAGAPIAKVTFDFPANSAYHFPASGDTKHGWGTPTPGSAVNGSSPLPLTFEKTNYSYDAFECNWGSYSIVSSMTTNYGNHQNALPANDSEYGYGKLLDATDQQMAPALQADEGLQKGFLYIDASEQPGDICSAPFVGDFCAGDKLMFSGWISGSNKMGGGDNRCPGGITLTVKGEHNLHDADGRIIYDEHGEPKKETVTLYRFCPGQIYELDDGPATPDGSGVDGQEWLKNANGDYIDGNGNVVSEENRVKNPNYDNNKYHVVWQQFYFEFVVTDKYDRHWIEVNNNCVSSQGGDFMLDNIAVYAIVPEVEAEVNTPLCVSVDENGNVITDMSLLKLNVEYNKLKSSANVNEDATVKPQLGFAFLDKEVFLRTFRAGLQNLSEAEKTTLRLEHFDFSTITLEELSDAIEDDEFIEIREGVEDGITHVQYLAYQKGFAAYTAAFDAAILGDKKTWYSKNPTENADNPSLMYFEWDPVFENMPTYSFANAVSKTSPVYGETVNGVKYLVMNGNFPRLRWKANTDYYLVSTNDLITQTGDQFKIFNLCSSCTKSTVFRIDPPYELVGLDKSEEANDYMVCEGQIPTLVTDLKGFDFNGVEVPMNDINYDWWLGDPKATPEPLLPTLATYHAQKKGDVRLDRALSTLRIYYPEVTSLDGITGHAATGGNPALTPEMVSYLQELVDAGQLVLHQKSISVPAEPAAADDPYFYLVACPIHDEQYDQALNPRGPASIIENGDMESFEDVSFRMSDPGTAGKVAAVITAGVGKNSSRGVKVTSSGTTANHNYDTQFFIRANEVIPVGDVFHIEFDYKSSAAATVSTQAHAAPGEYLMHGVLGDNLSFTTEWQHFSADVTVTTEMGPNFQSVAFNLWETRSSIDYFFDNVVLTVDKNQYVAFFCDEPQGLRVKVGEKAPTLKTGFVPGENGFDSYSYPTTSDPVLSIRLAKREQFETVQHGEASEEPVADPATAADNLHFLWLPIRDAQTQTAGGVIRKADDYNIYLASTNDPTWDKQIYKSMAKGALPVVGKIVQLYAVNTSGGSNLSAQNAQNRLCIYFTGNFKVREGYNYTLSLPFQEEGDVNVCSGTMLINLKIVPDYEVWTGAAGNTDWNNDENWRRADGNPGSSLGLDADELYVGAAAAGSPLEGYKTNRWNYRTAKDRVFRKGFTPLYCTHVLMMTDEWGNAPVLYDGLDASHNSQLSASPFPNLRDQDGWDGTAAEPEPTKATATPILRYDMQARLYDIWPQTYGDGVYPNKGRTGDLIAEMYQINSCDEIAFQPATELRNAHLLNYNSAWVEYQLDNKRWYLLGSPLQGTISGEWYAPTGTAKQKTTYYDPVTFTKYKPVTVTADDNPAELGYYILDTDKKYVHTTDETPADNTVYYKKTETTDYDRYSPAIYQRSWDKAKAVLYEVGSTYSIDDDDQGEYMKVTVESGQNPSKLGYYKLVGQEYVLATEEEPSADTVYYKKIYTENEGEWNNSGNWQTPTGGADQYLDRLGYKPMDGNKANVAIKGMWSNTYNDAQVDYATGGFSVMVMNHLKNNDQSQDNKSIVRLPKEDTMYDYYEFSQTNAYDGGTDTELSDVRTKNRALNRGRLKTDRLLPATTNRTEAQASRYGDRRTYTRIPIKEDELTAMNSSFVAQGADPATAGFFAEAVPVGTSNMGFYLVENPFPCGLDMEAFFDANPKLLKKYWLLTATGQHLVQRAATGEWFSPSVEDDADATILHFATANAVLPPAQGFFVQANPEVADDGVAVTADGVTTTTVSFNLAMQAQSRYGVQSGTPRTFNIEVGQTQRMEEVTVDVDLDGDGIFGETGIVINGETVNEQETVMTPVWEMEGDDYKLDENGNRIPVLDPIMQDVTLYTYMQTTDAGFVFPLKARRTRSDEYRPTPGLVVTAQRGADQSSALVMKRESASDDFLPSEDTETFISMDELKNIPTVYTLCGRLATTINSIHDFTCLPLGVESSSNAPCVLTFQGVEQLGDSVAFYDAVERKLTPLESGMKFTVSGQTQNRYYIVSSLNEEEVAEETHLQIFTEGRTAKVIASTAEPITDVRFFDAAGRLVHSASPQSMEYSFTLPDDGIYIIEAKTEKDRKTKKVAVK